MTIGYNPFDEDFNLEEFHEYRTMALSLREEKLRLLRQVDELKEDKRQLQKQVDELEKDLERLDVVQSLNETLMLDIDKLKEEQKNLDWYKMWHKKFKKEIDDLTLELETYRPTKLNGHGQCKCSNCGSVSWTDWFSRYKGQTLCDKCLKEIISTEEKQAVKDTAKEIFDENACKRKTS